jgi:hypothetical protein
MPSMTYCMFENTSSEMDQILNSLDEAFENGYTLKLRGEEKSAYERLIHQCQRFLKLDEMMTGDEEVDLADSCYIDADDLV